MYNTFKYFQSQPIYFKINFILKRIFVIRNGKCANKRRFQKLTANCRLDKLLYAPSKFAQGYDVETVHYDKFI